MTTVESNRRFAPDRSAVIVVDVQNDFCHPDGMVAQTGADTSAAVEMVSRLQHFINEARNAGVRVIFVQTTHDETTDSPVWLARNQSLTSQTKSLIPICRTGSWGAGFYQVVPQPSEPVVVKHRYSAFAGTTLDVVLHAAGVDSLLFTGVSTEICVESSLRDGLFHDYHVALVEDCCATYRPESHAATVDIVERAFGIVTTSAKMAAQWGGADQAKRGPVD